jgi:hypothetical protein
VHQLVQRGLVEPGEHVLQFFVVGGALGEAGAVGSPEGANEGLAVLAADLPILVAMAAVQSWLIHRAPPLGREC